MSQRYISHLTIRTRFAALLLLVLALLGASGCAGSPLASGGPESLFEQPARWYVVTTKEKPQLRQVDLTTRDGHGRIMVAEHRLADRPAAPASYLAEAHSELVAELQRQSRTAAQTHSALFWDNGVVAHRTTLRGRLGQAPVTMIATTLTRGEHLYFNCGLFFEGSYAELRRDYHRVLQTLRPLRGATMLHEQPLDDGPQAHALATY